MKYSEKIYLRAELRTDPDFKQKITAKAAKEDLTISGVIRNLLAQWLADKIKVNKKFPIK